MGGEWAALRELGPYFGIGTSFAATILLGLGVGYWTDGRLGTKPLGMLLGGLFGLLAAGLQFWTMYRSLTSRK